MHGRVPRGIVNREITDNEAWKRKLKEFAGRFG
jgi:hypothetical protein